MTVINTSTNCDATTCKSNTDCKDNTAASNHADTFLCTKCKASTHLFMEVDYPTNAVATSYTYTIPNPIYGKCVTVCPAGTFKGKNFIYIL